jgi:predicted nucleic acid-binding protein
VTAPNGVVLDASAALGWLLGDVDDETRGIIDGVLTQGFALVPELWHTELANALRTCVRTGRIEPDYIDSACRLMDRLDIRTDVVGAPIQRLTAEALHHDLSAYDTSYLVLARDRGLPLATLDRQLAAVAAREGIALALDA